MINVNADVIVLPPARACVSTSARAKSGDEVGFDIDDGCWKPLFMLNLYDLGEQLRGVRAKWGSILRRTIASLSVGRGANTVLSQTFMLTQSHLNWSTATSTCYAVVVRLPRDWQAHRPLAQQNTEFLLVHTAGTLSGHQCTSEPHILTANATAAAFVIATTYEDVVDGPSIVLHTCTATQTTMACERQSQNLTAAGIRHVRNVPGSSSVRVSQGDNFAMLVEEFAFMSGADSSSGNRLVDAAQWSVLTWGNVWQPDSLSIHRTSNFSEITLASSMCFSPEDGLVVGLSAGTLDGLSILIFRYPEDSASIPATQDASGSGPAFGGMIVVSKNLLPLDLGTTGALSLGPARNTSEAGCRRLAYVAYHRVGLGVRGLIAVDPCTGVALQHFKAPSWQAVRFRSAGPVVVVRDGLGTGEHAIVFTSTSLSVHVFRADNLAAGPVWSMDVGANVTSYNATDDTVRLSAYMPSTLLFNKTTFSYDLSVRSVQCHLGTDGSLILRVRVSKPFVSGHLVIAMVPVTSN